MNRLVIIGNSLTGLFASIIAAQNGYEVKLIGEGTGMIHISSGCIDLLGTSPLASDKIVENPLKSISNLIESSYSHPYSQIGIESLSESIKVFQDISHTCGLNYMGSPEKNRYFITAAGTLKQSCLYPSSFHTPSINQIEAIRFLEIKGIPGFFPALAASLSRKIFPQKKIDYQTMELYTEKGEQITSLSLSHCFIDIKQRDYFVKKLENFCQPKMAIGIPAIFQPLTAIEIIQRVKKQYGVWLFEMATIPPSLPGYLLGQSLLEYAVSLGVEPFIGGKATKYSASGTKIEKVMIQRPGRDLSISGDYFLLATGTLLGGGLKIDEKKVIEPLFNLPVKFPEFKSWFGNSFHLANHPIHKSGVEVNKKMQPISGNGSLVYDNLLAAGTILNNADIINERSGGGICLGSAYKAISTLLEKN